MYNLNEPACIYSKTLFMLFKITLLLFYIILHNFTTQLVFTQFDLLAEWSVC